MLANVGDEPLGKLASGVELSEVANDATPNDLTTALDLARRRRLVVPGGAVGVEVERVPERGNGLRHVPAQPLQALLHRRRRRGVLGLGRALGAVVGPHQDLLHHVLVRARAARPALQCRGHGWSEASELELWKTGFKASVVFSLWVSLSERCGLDRRSRDREWSVSEFSVFPFFFYF